MKFISLISPKTLLKFFSLWPPYLISGISIKSVNSDLSEVVVQKTNSFWNKNYFGTHFGGTLYAMCDPFFVFMALHKLRKDHIVWDKSAEIEFVRATSKPATAFFSLPDKDVQNLKKLCLENFKVEPSFIVEIKDPEGQLVAKVKKRLYIRRKDAKTRFPKNSSNLLP